MTQFWIYIITFFCQWNTNMLYKYVFRQTNHSITSILELHNHLHNWDSILRKPISLDYSFWLPLRYSITFSYIMDYMSVISMQFYETFLYERSYNFNTTHSGGVPVAHLCFVGHDTVSSFEIYGFLNHDGWYLIYLYVNINDK